MFLFKKEKKLGFKKLLNSIVGEKVALFLIIIMEIIKLKQMKKIYTLCLLLITILQLQAQEQPRGFHLDRPVNMAAILSKKPSTALGFSSVSEARSIINDIMDAVDMRQNFKVLSTTQVDNAAAVMYQNERYILYNPSFIDQLDEVAKDKWASISVIGHEIGHHLLGHTLDGRGSQIPKELEADEFSGLVLHRMGASLQQAQLAMRLIGSPYASATHPAEQDRLEAISKGWSNTTVQRNRPDDIAISTPENRNANPHTYPSNRNREDNYPSNNRRNYPTDRRQSYPSNEDEDTYPSSGNTRGNYPNSNDSRTYGGRNNSGPWRGNSSGVQVVYDLRFNNYNGQQYYVTSQNDVIILRGNQGVVVAKIAATNFSRYPYVIYDDQQQIYIDRTGNLFSESGRSVGFLTRHN